MREIKHRMVLLIAVLLCGLLFAGCTRVVVNNSDELCMNSWGAQLDNGTSISLEFSLDKAKMSISFTDQKTVKLSGLCEVSETDFVIHDETTNLPYAFSYIVHFDRVEILYCENTVSLYKL